MSMPRMRRMSPQEESMFSGVRHGQIAETEEFTVVMGLDDDRKWRVEVVGEDGSLAYWLSSSQQEAGAAALFAVRVLRGMGR